MKFVNDLKLERKIAGSFLLIIIILLIISTANYLSFRDLASVQSNVYSNNLQPAENLAASGVALERMQADLYRYVAAPAERDGLSNSIDREIAIVNENMTQYGKKSLNPDEKASLARFGTAWQDVQSGYRQVMSDAKANNRNAVELALAANSSLARARQLTLSEIAFENDQINSTAGTLNNEVGDIISSAKRVIIVLSILALIACIGICWYLIHDIVDPIERVKKGIHDFHEGRVSNRVSLNRKDELGEMGDALDKFAADFEKYILGTMNMVADGDLSRNLKPRGEKDEMIPPIKKMIETLRALIEESNKLSRATVEGKLSVRGNADQFKGGYWEIIAGINKTMDQVVHPLHEGMKISEAFANGNFTARFDPKIEVHGDFKKFRQSLDNIGIQISSSLGSVSKHTTDLSAAAEEAASSTHEVAEGANQIATNAQKVSENSEKCSVSIDQVLKAIEDMGSAVQEVTTNMEAVSQQANHATEAAKNGAALAENVEKDMRDIESSTETVYSIVKEIEKQMNDITQIVGLIRDLANQTNLLALNAAIEAARAGESGRGFAVVASEVKSLAEESRASAEKIEQMINELNRATKNATEATGTSKGLVIKGAQMSTQTIMAFRKITEAAEKVANAAAEVAAATEEQAATTEEITASMHEVQSQIANTAKEAGNAAAATEETTASINEINKVVDNVNKIVENVSQEIAKFTI